MQLSEKSPLFVSAIELLAHSIDLYTQGNVKKYKFVILHLANAVELILKDKVIDLGLTIYKDNNKQTIGIWESFKILESEKINIAERPVIELLVDDRNTIQHRFGFPNAESVFYYMQQVQSFFVRFLSENYGVDLREVLLLHTTLENLRVVGLDKDEEAEVDALDGLFLLAPESAVLHAWSLLERHMAPYLSAESTRKGKPAIMLWHHKDFNDRLIQLRNAKLVDNNILEDFSFLRQMRNKAAHSQHHESTSLDEWRKATEIGKKLLHAIEAAIHSGLFDGSAENM